MKDLLGHVKNSNRKVLTFNEAKTLRPTEGYRVIYADPPWKFKNWSKAGEEKNAVKKYDCLNITDIQNMAVGALAGENCILFLWITDPLLPQGIETIKKWGFKYKTVGFTWHKIRPTGAEFLGLGYHTRGNPEMCLIGSFGKIGSPRNRGIRQYQQHHVREHSKKPDQIRDLIAEMYEGPRIELFSREKFEGWDQWRNQDDKFVGDKDGKS